MSVSSSVSTPPREADEDEEDEEDEVLDADAPVEADASEEAAAVEVEEAVREEATATDDGEGEGYGSAVAARQPLPTQHFRAVSPAAAPPPPPAEAHGAEAGEGEGEGKGEGEDDGDKAPRASIDAIKSGNTNWQLHRQYVGDANVPNAQRVVQHLSPRAAKLMWTAKDVSVTTSRLNEVNPACIKAFTKLTESQGDLGVIAIFTPADDPSMVGILSTKMTFTDHDLATPAGSPMVVNFSSAFKMSDGWCVARAFLLILLGRGDPSGPYIIADHPRK